MGVKMTGSTRRIRWGGREGGSEGGREGGREGGQGRTERRFPETRSAQGVGLRRPRLGKHRGRNREGGRTRASLIVSSWRPSPRLGLGLEGRREGGREGGAYLGRRSSVGSLVGFPPAC